MNRVLLLSLTKKDFKREVFRCGGAGGQHQNKTSSGVRIKHPASGAVGESRDTRSQSENQKLAFRRLCDSEKFKNWHRIEVARITGQMKSPEEIQREVDRELADPAKVKVETYVPR